MGTDQESGNPSEKNILANLTNFWSVLRFELEIIGFFDHVKL